MDTRGHSGQNGTRNARLSEATTRHGTQRTDYLETIKEKRSVSIARNAVALRTFCQVTLVSRAPYLVALFVIVDPRFDVIASNDGSQRGEIRETDGVSAAISECK